MSEHTPGPWTVETVVSLDGEHLAVWHDYDEDGETGIDEICDLVMDYSPGIPEANARLIAAAPDMLAALELAVQHERPCRFSKGVDDVKRHLLTDGTLGATREECWLCRCRDAVNLAKTGTR